MKRKFRSWLGWFNFYIVQWFGIRLARVVSDEGVQTGWTVIRMRPGAGWEDVE